MVLMALNNYKQYLWLALRTVYNYSAYSGYKWPSQTKVWDEYFESNFASNPVT